MSPRIDAGELERFRDSLNTLRKRKKFLEGRLWEDREELQRVEMVLSRKREFKGFCRSVNANLAKTTTNVERGRLVDEFWDIVMGGKKGRKSK